MTAEEEAIRFEFEVLAEMDGMGDRMTTATANKILALRRTCPHTEDTQFGYYIRCKACGTLKARVMFREDP